MQADGSAAALACVTNEQDRLTDPRRRRARTFIHIQQPAFPLCGISPTLTPCLTTLAETFVREVKSGLLSCRALRHTKTVLAKRLSLPLLSISAKRQNCAD